MPAKSDRPTLMLATDLSGRCDRAQDRAVQLARAWQTALHVVHAVEPGKARRDARLTRNLPPWRQPADPQATMLRRLRDDLEADGVAASVHVGEGRSSQVVLEAARREAIGLVITGLGRDKPLDRIQLGSTVNELLRDLSVPLLTVRGRVRGPYRHVVVASDFSPQSRPALEAAVGWFGEGRLTLFHAFEPSSGDPGDNAAEIERRGAAATTYCDRFLAESSLAPEATARLSRVLASGYPEALLPDFVRHEGVDLVVLGTHGRGGMLKALFGSTAETLLHLLECDTMVVRSR